MEWSSYQSDDEILRARFTAWLERLMSNTRKNYINKIGKEPQMVDLDSVSGAVLTYEDQYDLNLASERVSFEFEEEKLARAFCTMPPRRQQIITLLFDKQLSAAEVAKKLQCSVQYVYNQKSLALKILRERMNNQEE